MNKSENMYKNKYLKYKTKYLSLKNQLGSEGPQIYTSIIVTHNGRIRCLLDLLGFSNNTTINPKKQKFMNCVILKLIVSSRYMSIEMIYQGDLSSEGNYDMSNYFTKLNSSTNKGIEEAGVNTYVFYIVRHGDGIHNKAKQEGILSKGIQIIRGLLKDASLTPIGENQGKVAGEKLGEFKPVINFLFSSDLKRTRQTLYKLLEGGKDNITFSPPNQKFNNITILPCSHELDYKSEKCDGNQGITAQENEMSCSSITMCPLTKTIKTDFCSYLPPINDSDSKNLCLNWSYYSQFYGMDNGGSRKKSGDKSQKCRDTNMIKQAISIISMSVS
jgi:broad specificity phosphatase PhoE